MESYHNRIKNSLIAFNVDQRLKKVDWITDWFKAHYLYSEMVQTYGDGSTFVEIGTWTGKSAAYMASLIKEYHKSIRFYTIDTFNGSTDEPEHAEIIKTIGGDLFSFCHSNLSQCGILDKVNIIRMDSIEASKLFADDSIDFLFIDGGHSYEQVCKDVKAWYPKLKIGSYMAGDDIDSPAVYDAITELIGIDNFNVERYSWIHIKKSEKSWN